MRLGKIEKFVILIIYRSKLSTSELLSNSKSKENDGPSREMTDRSDVIVALYNARNEQNLRRRANLRTSIPEKEYNYLQVAITRAADKLECQNLIRVGNRASDIEARWIGYSLTEEGEKQAKILRAKMRHKNGSSAMGIAKIRKFLFDLPES